MLVKNHSCRNCGSLTHLYRACTQPITSFGIICVRFGSNCGNAGGGGANGAGEPEYLMIQRKDSLCFMEFIRGKYETTDSEYIKKLLFGMTPSERQMILTRPFQDIWNYIWLQPSLSRLTLEFESAKTKFESIQANFPEYIQSTESPYEESEFGFPKGRRKLRENDLTCAIREFHEETGFAESDIYVYRDVAPFEEIFYGTNNVRYRHVYYLARMIKQDSDNPQIDPENINQMREVRAIKWFNYEQTVAHIRDYNIERKNLFAIVHKRVLEMEARTGSGAGGGARAGA
jgi:8-oxo-dGTP pyrophosphatase MutT (NUDIX family)